MVHPRTHGLHRESCLAYGHRFSHWLLHLPFTCGTRNRLAQRQRSTLGRPCQLLLCFDAVPRRSPVFILKKLKPEFVPIEKPGFFNFKLVIFIINEIARHRLHPKRGSSPARYSRKTEKSHTLTPKTLRMDNKYCAKCKTALLRCSDCGGNGKKLGGDRRVKREGSGYVCHVHGGRWTK